MPYTLSRLLSGVPMAEAEARTRAALAAHGFGVLTEIDVSSVMKAKLGKDMAGYRILGACNPQMAFEALGMEPRVGAMLPCNVILRTVAGGTELAAIDPVASMASIPNDDLKRLALQVRDLLAEVVAAA